MITRTGMMLLLVTCSIFSSEAQTLPKFTVSSPTPLVSITPFNPTLFPNLTNIVPGPEASITAILTNNSDKTVVACNIRWSYSIQGRPKQSFFGVDSFLSPSKQPVLLPHARALVTSSAILPESLIGAHHIRGVGKSDHRILESPYIAAVLDIVVFDDGEVVGPDEHHYVEELRGRKAAADYVANQISAATSRMQDASSVLLPLSTDTPMYEDHIAVWKHQFAAEYLRSPNKPGFLRYLQTLPALPPFYRR